MEVLVETVGHMLLFFIIGCLLTIITVGFITVLMVIAIGFNIPHLFENIRTAIAVGFGASGFISFFMGLIIALIGD